MLREERGNGFRPVLEVAIHRDDDVAGDEVERRAECHLMTEVPRQRDDDEPRIHLRRGVEQLERPIGAPIIH